jgi:hypothetical protein
MGAAAKRAQEGVAAIQQVNWQPIDALPNVTGDRAPDAARLLTELRQVLELDELAIPLGTKLREIERLSVALLIPLPTPVVHPPPPPTPPAAGWKVVDEASHGALTVGQARERFDAALRKTRDDRARVTVSWKIEERTGD